MIYAIVIYMGTGLLMAVVQYGKGRAERQGQRRYAKCTDPDSIVDEVIAVLPVRLDPLTRLDQGHA